jgi:sugar phosphate isomerase/epimerase
LRALGGDKVVTVSLVDAETEAAADAPLASRRPPGEGAIDLPAVLTVLTETRYDGPVTPEADRSQFGNLGRDQIVKQAGAALDRVWKAAGLSPTGKLSPSGKLATAPGRS